MIEILQVPDFGFYTEKYCGKWYVYKYNTHEYLHSDGNWHTKCTQGPFWNTTGYYDSKEDAEQIISKYGYKL